MNAVFKLLFSHIVQVRLIVLQCITKCGGKCCYILTLIFQVLICISGSYIRWEDAPNLIDIRDILPMW